MAALNIPAHVKSLAQQGQPTKIAKKKHNKTVPTTEPPNLHPRRPRNNAEQQHDPIGDTLQPIGDFLSDNVIEEEPKDNTVNKRNGRGKTTMDDVFSISPDQMPKIEVSLNYHGQPVGKSGRRFASALGCQVRKTLSIAAEDWRLIDPNKKDKVWTEMKYFELDDTAFDWVMSSAWVKWKNFRAEIKKKYFDPEVTIEEIPECPDKRVNEEDWQKLYNYWMTADSQERSTRAKQNRKKSKLHHAAGSVSFACSEHVLAMQLGHPPRRDETFVKTHTRKNGVSTEQAEPIIGQFQTIAEIYPELLEKTIQEGDSFSVVCGTKEPKGRVRVMGLGPTPQDIGTPGLKSYKPTRLQMETLVRTRAESEKVALQQRIQELEAQLEQKEQKDRASEEPMSHHGSTSHAFLNAMDHEDNQDKEAEELQSKEDEELDDEDDQNFYISLRPVGHIAISKNDGAPQSKHDNLAKNDGAPQSKHDNLAKNDGAPQSKHDNLVGKAVILYALLRSDMAVAKGTIVSTKPSTMVAGEPLGRQYCEVVVTSVLKRDSILPRPYDDMKTMGDADKMPLAWPYNRLKVTKKGPTPPGSGHVGR